PRDVLIALPRVGAVTGDQQDHDVDEKHRGQPRPRQSQPKTALRLHCLLLHPYCCLRRLIKTETPNTAPPISSAAVNPPAATHTGTISRGGAALGMLSGIDNWFGGLGGPSGTSQ